ncbi:MAG: hypothetical protein WA087_01325 [Candidatus Saccharimonadales bacterium]
MKLSNKNQRGFSPIIIVVAVVAIGLVGLLGYVAYDRFIATDTDTNSNVAKQSAVADDMKTITESVPKEVVSTSDLDKAITSLDQITDTETKDDVNLINSQLAEF